MRIHCSMFHSQTFIVCCLLIVWTIQTDAFLTTTTTTTQRRHVDEVGGTRTESSSSSSSSSSSRLPWLSIRTKTKRPSSTLQLSIVDVIAPMTTTTTTTTTMNLCSILRGGATDALLDMSREDFKLQSMTKYSTITALIMNASLRLYTSQKFDFGKVDENGNRPRQIRLLESLFTASTTLCIVSGVFTAVLFNVLGIYSKEALGMGNQAGYLAFQTATAVYRKWGFRAFLTTCLSFVTSFVTSVVEKTSNEDRLGQWILGASMLLLALGVFHIQHVLAIATKLIYTPEFVAMNHIA